MRRQSEPFFGPCMAEAATRSKACVGELASMLVDMSGVLSRTYCVHAEVVTDTVLPACASRVSRLLAVLTNPLVDVLQGHSVVRCISEAAVEKLCVARIGDLTVDSLAGFVFFGDGVLVVHEVNCALSRDIARRIVSEMLRRGYLRVNIVHRRHGDWARVRVVATLIDVRWNSAERRSVRLVHHDVLFVRVDWSMTRIRMTVEVRSDLSF